jgi:adenylate cyclase class 2
MEVETKFRTDDLEALRSKLINMGAVFSKVTTQIDEYFKPKGREREVQRPGSFILRIRIEGDKSTFTYKNLTDRTGVWVEHETEISDPAEMKNILTKAGFSQLFTITKTRTTGHIGELELCLDHVKELGDYLEIALDSENGEEAKQKISDFMAKIGISEKDVEHRGYAAIISQNMGIKFEGTNG